METPKKALTFEELNRGRAVSMNGIHLVDEYTFVRYYQAHKEVFTRWMLTVSRGISGRLKILEYNVKDLVRCGGLYTIGLDGTILTMDKSAGFFLGWVMSLYSVIFFVCRGILESDSGAAIETDSLEKISVTMNQVVPFVLGSYVALALQRWWSIRYDGLAEIFNAIVDIQMLVACILHPDRLRPIRTLIMKWGFASIFLLMKAVRGNASMTDMLYKCLLSEAELHVLQEVADLHGRAEVLWAWILRLCHESFDDACGPMPYSIQLNKISDLCMRGSDGINIILINLDTPLPFVYVHLITLLVDINTMFFVAKTAVFSSVAFAAGDYSRMGTELLQCILVPLLYRGLLAVAAQIFDPFGDDVLDFPIGSYMDWAATCCEDLFLAQQRFPGVPASVYAQDEQGERTRPSEEDPAKFATTRDKFREGIMRAFRSGKLHTVVLKTQEIMKDPDAAAALEKDHEVINNVKSKEAQLSAQQSAEPIAAEIRKLGKTMKGELIVLRHYVHSLHKAVAADALHQDDQFLKAVEFVDRLQDQISAGSPA
jgi:hypothetical protein